MTTSSPMHSLLVCKKCCVTSSIAGVNVNLCRHFGNQYGSFRKLGIRLPQDPAIPFLDIYPKDAQSYHKDTRSTMFIAALFVIVRTWKQPRCPSSKEWVKKMWYIYTMKYYSAVRKWYYEICRQMDGTRKRTS